MPSLEIEDVIGRLAVRLQDGAFGEHVVVQFDRGLSASETRALSAAGLVLLDHLGADAYLATVDAARFDPQGLALVDALAWAGEVSPRWKFDPLVAEALRGSRTGLGDAVPPYVRLDGASGNEVAAVVVFHRDVGHDDRLMTLLDVGATILSVAEPVRATTVGVDLAQLEVLASRDEIQWIEFPLPAFEVGMDSARATVKADEVMGDVPTGTAYYKPNSYNRTGAGVQVMVYDGGDADTNHPDLGTRVRNNDQAVKVATNSPYPAYFPVGPAPIDPGSPHHSTYVAGIIGSTGQSSAPGPGAHRGLAPEVDLEVYAYESPSFNLTGPYGPGSWYVLYQDPGDLAYDFDHAINTRDVDIATSSVGSAPSIGLGHPLNGACGIFAAYGVTAALVDSIVVGSLGRRLPVVWLAGNDRTPGGPCGSGDQSLGPPASAKNAIVVGSIANNAGVITSSVFSGRGPTEDGRIKPDLVAPGEDVISTNHTGAGSGAPYAAVGSAGTSWATPIVTGIGALMIEHHRALAGPNDLPFGDPLNSTIKALLIHNAVDVVDVAGGVPAGADTATGWGLVDAEATLRFMDPADASRPGFYLEASVDPNATMAPVAFCAASPTPVAVDTYLMSFEHDGSGPVEVTLAWDDVPGVPNTSLALVNDLDLLVRDPFGVAYYPDPSGPASTAQLDDDVNNVESARVSAAQSVAGVWTVEVAVDAFGPNSGQQWFSLCVSANANGPVADCNGNGTPDGNDIAMGLSADVNANGVPDECELDCNDNSLPDAWEISSGCANDWNADGVPDECQTLTPQQAVAQDVCAGAMPICNGVYYGSTVDASIEGVVALSCDIGVDFNHSVWYRFESAFDAPADPLRITVDNTELGYLHNVLEVSLHATCDGVTEALACQAGVPPIELVATLGGVAGTDYFVRVATLGAGEFEMAVDGPTCFAVPGVGYPCQPDIGFGGPGPARLSVCGPALEPGAENFLYLSGLPPAGNTALFVGAEFNPTPFKGGLLVPLPTSLLIGPLPVDSAGTAGLVVPAVPSSVPYSVFLQAVYEDATLPAGFGLSNSVNVVMLP